MQTCKLHSGATVLTLCSLHFNQQALISSWRVKWSPADCGFHQFLRNIPWTPKPRVWTRLLWNQASDMKTDGRIRARSTMWMKRTERARSPCAWIHQRRRGAHAALSVERPSPHASIWRSTSASTPERDPTPVHSAAKASTATHTWSHTSARTPERNPTAARSAGNPTRT